MDRRGDEGIPKHSAALYYAVSIGLIGLCLLVTELLEGLE